MKPANPNLPLNPEIDFVHLAKTIWQRRMLVVKLTGIAAVLGFLLSFLSPVRYTSTTTMVQEIMDPTITLNEAKFSAISALAAVAGVDINGLSKAKMSTKTFSAILTSVPFRKELMKTTLNFGGKDTATTLYNYYSKRTLNSPIDVPDSQNPNQLTREELNINKILDKQITIQILDDQYISISCTLPKAKAAAQLTRKAEQLLQHFLTDLQTEKPRANLQFVQERYDQAKSNFLQIQEELTLLQEERKKPETLSFKSAVSQTLQERRLSADCRLAEKLYAELATKLEQSKITLNEQIPVFRIVDPVTIPTEKSSPNRSKTTLIFAFFGFVIAMILILGKDFFEDTREKWRKN
ncbi:MAG: Wzz/FepE/Etk N-terminal domain-containing protein [Prolixibacteraceae bacterium]